MATTTRLRAARRSRGFSQKRLAELLGVDHSAVSLWESGKHRPHPRTGQKLADVFGVPVDQLLNNDEGADPKADPSKSH